MTTDLELAIAQLKVQAGRSKFYWDYYDGNHPQVYVAERLKEVFEAIDGDFELNWSALVIDACADRIKLQGFASPDETLTATMTSLWEQLAIYQESEDVHDGALVTGESYLIIWRDGDSLNPIEIYQHDSSMCQLFYEEDRPKVKRFAAKWYFSDTDHRLHIVLYYPDRIEKYVSNKDWKSGNSEMSGFDVPVKQVAYSLEVPPENHPFGVVPVFRFATNRRKPKSDLKSVVPPQNAVNKMLMDMMVAAEFSAFRQRWVISNADIVELKNRPGSILDIPAGDGVGQDTTVGEFEETNLQNYMTTLDGLAQGISAITQTPKHYFFRDGTPPSGEALMALEAPLVHKAQKRIDQFTPTWKEVMSFLVYLNTNQWPPLQLIIPTFESPATVQPLTQAQVHQANTAAGIPVITQLRDEGKTQAWLDQMAKDKKDESKTTATALTKAIMDAQAKDEGGGSEEPADEE